jgi:thymidylate synthase (FAD)
MKLIEQSWQWGQKPVYPLELIEIAGRTCYKSESEITPESARKFVRMLLKRGHESVIEHASASVRFITNRGVTHELVRHRLCAFSQESTRYVDYQEEMEFILPVWFPPPPWGPDEPAAEQWPTFTTSLIQAENKYRELRMLGWRAEQAREVLPNALKTEIVVTANLREWRHIFRLRTSKAAHPQMRALMLSCLRGFKKEFPVLFDDIPDEEVPHDQDH